LGIPKIYIYIYIYDFQDVIDKVLHKVECWKAKSVVVTIPSYAISTFLLLISVSNALDKILI
jgi:hypothetical protein